MCKEETVVGSWARGGVTQGLRWRLWRGSFYLCRRVSLLSVSVMFLAGQVVDVIWQPRMVGLFLGIGLSLLMCHWVVGRALTVQQTEPKRVLAARGRRTAVVLFSSFVVGVLSVHQMTPHGVVGGADMRIRGLIQTIRRPQAGAVQFRVVGYRQGDAQEGERRLSEERAVTLLCQAADLPWRAASRIRVGDAVELVGSIQPLNEGDRASSYERSLTRAGYDGRCQVRWLSFYRPALSETSSFGAWQQRWVKHPIQDRIAAIVRDKAGDTEGAVLLLSLTFGTRDRLSRETEDLFRFFGLSHLLVLSGYQLSQLIRLVGGVMQGVIAPLWRWVDRVPLYLVSPIVSGSIGLPLAAMVGFEVSITRALIGSMLVEIVRQREGIKGMGHSIAVTALVMSALWPGILCEPAGALTMSALIGILVGSAIGGTGVLGVIGAHAGALLCTFLVSCLWFRPPHIIAAIITAPFAGVMAIVAFYGTLGGLGLLATGVDSNGVCLRSLAEGAESVRRVLWWARGDSG